MKTAEEWVSEQCALPPIKNWPEMSNGVALILCQKIQQDTIQSSENYKKGYLDCGNKLLSIANQVEYPTKEMEEFIEFKRKEFGL